MKLILLFTCIIPFVLQLTQAFCIYNQLEGEDSTLHIFDSLVNPKSFEKTIPSGGKECCHFSNMDCNSYGTRESIKDFNVIFGFNGTKPKDNIELHGVCDAGGTLVFKGSSIDDVILECLKSDGITTTGFLRPT